MQGLNVLSIGVGARSSRPVTMLWDGPAPAAGRNDSQAWRLPGAGARPPTPPTSTGSGARPPRAGEPSTRPMTRRPLVNARERGRSRSRATVAVP